MKLKFKLPQKRKKFREIFQRDKEVNSFSHQIFEGEAVHVHIKMRSIEDFNKSEVTKTIPSADETPITIDSLKKFGFTLEQSHNIYRYRIQPYINIDYHTVTEQFYLIKYQGFKTDPTPIWINNIGDLQLLISFLTPDQ